MSEAERKFVANSLADNFAILGVPEPSTITLLALAACAMMRRKRTSE